METKELVIETPGFEQSGVKVIGRLGSYCEIAVPQGTRSLPVVVTPQNANKRFASYGIQGGSSREQNSKTVEVTTKKPFGDFPPIPVHWNGTIPQTREEPRDNFRVVQINRNGGLDQMEIGIATRGPQVFLIVQLQFRGIILPSRNGDAPTIAPALEHFS